MLIGIEHTTELSYSGLISETVMELRMAPRQESGQQRLSFDLAVGPTCQIRSYFDWLGNTVHAFSINGLHKSVKIVASSVVQTHHQHSRSGSLPDRWPPSNLPDYTLLDFLKLESPIGDCPELDRVVGEIKPRESARQLDVAMEVMRYVSDEFQYEKGVTSVSTTVEEVLTHRRGVCQDFAQVMVGILRKLAIPCRYVSGFIHAGNRGYRGATQTHAWCEAYFPSAGWVGFDPTNNCPAGENFVKMAVGTNYRDVPPHKGVYRGSARETMSVSVITRELRELTNRLVGERTGSLEVPVFNFAGRGPVGGWILDEQVQQQQQQQQCGTLMMSPARPAPRAVNPASAGRACDPA
jgi:transglutaminase-like putative cysteine protease